MNKEFVLYDESLQLKELGFDEDCFGYYDTSGYIDSHSDSPLMMCDYNSEDTLEDGSYPVSAPLYQQVFRWFRKKHNLYYHVFRDKENKNKFSFSIDFNDKIIPFFISFEEFDSFEKTELACINKMIEIVKENK